MLGVMQSAQKFGLKTEAFEGSLKELKKIEEPTILHIVKKETIEYYVVCYGYYEHTFLIGDHEDGVKEIASEELELLWRSST